ncbi:GT-D fold domain-containing glycosyltransferase [Clostridium sp. B9]|uniref:GT-D fold domain-containing glycosyltransferase n=1 Tax=Clostridium sp. B9 TaxID=3423224 RepID=UPI003D2EE573
MKTIIEIKQKLNQNIIGKIFIKIYHYIIAIPVAKIYSLKFYLIKNKLKDVKFYSIENTFSMLKDKNKSLCRFGDGEISWIYQDSKGYFGQENSKELSNRLHSIISSERDNILIAVPDFFGSMKSYSKKRRESRNTHLAKYYKRWNELLDENRFYSDALITRVYYGCVDNRSKWMFKRWKDIWENKNLIIIEGSQTRFGVGNDLLSNAKNIKRIIAPAENAFAKYNEILDSSKKYISEDVIFLISLGPTATVLAYDIGICGGQAIDIGHLDIEYEWYLSGTIKKKPIAGKYVNEAGGASSIEIDKKILDKYKSEIIKYIV